MDNSKEKAERSSVIISSIAEKLKASTITVGEFLELLGDRSFGIVILVFCLPNAIPAGIPGISTITGVPIMLFAIQLMMGKETLWVPKWLREKELHSHGFRKVLEKSVKGLILVEKFLKPRFKFISNRDMEKVAGAAIFIMAGIMALPIPLGNFPPAIAIIIMALAVMEEDGAALIIGVLCSIAATIFVGGLVSGFAIGVQSLFNFLN